jgi:RimJ/RimL family protein N-acetyltransferase
MAMILGNRIGLRPFEYELTDDEMNRVYRWSRDEHVLRLSGGSPTDLTFAEFRERFENDHRNPLHNRRMFFIIKRSQSDANGPMSSTNGGELIGRIGCFAIDWDKSEGELGIVIGETADWGKGYGREAVTLLLRYLFQTTGLVRINLYTYPDNLRAQRSFAACGFRTIGAARRFSPDLGEYDGVEMEITRGEFLKRERAHATGSISFAREKE